MSGPLKLLPLGGLGEIGMNCLYVEYGGEAILIDCGLQFSDLDHFGIEFVIPDFSYVRENIQKLKAIVCTHGHEDHIGAIPFAFGAGVDVPIYATDFTRRMIFEKSKEHGLAERLEIRTLKPGQKVELGHFKITPVLVNHSLVEAAALFIDTPVGKIIHTGDFKIDPCPYFGKPMSLEEFKKAGDEGVLLLLSDSTNVEREKPNPGEDEIGTALEQAIAATEGMAVVATFSSSISRLGQIIDIADRLGRKVAVAGRSMETNVRLAEEADYFKKARKVLIDSDEIGSIDKSKLILLSTGAQGEYRSALVRIANAEHRDVKIGQGDRVILSARAIPGNEKAISRLINNLFKQGADVLYGAVHQVHVSGHATRPELERMIKAVRPKFFIPVHGEYRHLVMHARLAKQCGVEHTRVVANGDIMELTRERLDTVGQLEETRIFIADRAGRDIPKDLLRERRKLAETGVIFVMMVRSDHDGKVVSGPEFVFNGVGREEDLPGYLERTRKVVLETIKEYSRFQEVAPRDEFEEEIRIRIRRMFNELLGKKPVVVPVVLEV